PADLPGGNALAGRAAAGVQAGDRLPELRGRRRHPARLSRGNTRRDAERRLRSRPAAAPQAAGADRSAAAACRAGRGKERRFAIGCAQGSHAAGARGRRGAARRGAAAGGPEAGRASGGTAVKLLVTGATGFLGSTLVPMLVEAGHDVRVLARSGVALKDVEVVKGDVRDTLAVTQALRGREALYHLAGLVSRDPDDARKMYELHVAGTRNLLKAASGLQRIVLASSSGTIGVSRTRRIATEEDDYPIETVGRWPYYLSKIYEEKIALQSGLPVVVLNPSLLL